jgi:uncharacterized membrane protein
MATVNETVAKKDSGTEANAHGNGPDPKTLAGLCYIPILFINILVPLYVLITGKGGRFAKFHAVQALLMYVAYFILVQLVMIPYYLAFGSIYADLFSGKQVGTAALSSMGGMFVMMIPTMLLFVGFLIYSIYLAVKAFGGNEAQVPVIGKYAAGVAGN